MNIKYLDVYQDIISKFSNIFYFFLVMGASTPVSQSGFPVFYLVFKKMPQVQHVSVFNLSLKISQAKTSVSITQQDIQIHLLRARDHQICMYMRIISS
jgi:hypothetical protein